MSNNHAPLAAVPDPDVIDEILDAHQDRARKTKVRNQLVLPNPKELLEEYPAASQEYVDAWYEVYLRYESAVEDVRHEGKYANTPAQSRTGAHQRLDAFTIKLFDIAHKSLKYRAKNSAGNDAIDMPPSDDSDQQDDENSGGLFGFD